MTSWTSPQTNDNTGTQYNLKLTCDDPYHPIHPVQNTHEHTITSGSCLICECVQSAFITGQMILQPCQLPDPHREWADENKAWCFMCSGCTPMKRMISWFPLFPVFFWWVCDDDPEEKKTERQTWSTGKWGHDENRQAVPKKQETAGGVNGWTLFQDDSQEQVNRREQGQASDRTAGAGKQIRWLEAEKHRWGFNERGT